ncbi:hypothetical protein AAMO2058_001400100 [Amorphochlora amoebiformis]
MHHIVKYKLTTVAVELKLVRSQSLQVPSPDEHDRILVEEPTRRYVSLMPSQLADLFCLKVAKVIDRAIVIQAPTANGLKNKIVRDEKNQLILKGLTFPSGLNPHVMT